MSLCPAVNPFDLELIRERILQHLVPAFSSSHEWLLKCREVNRSWNESATRLLIRGQPEFSVHLRGAGLAEYLRLLKATQGAPAMNLGLHLHLHPDSACKKQLSIAIELLVLLQERNLKAAVVTSLDCILAPNLHLIDGEIGDLLSQVLSFIAPSLLRLSCTFPLTRRQGRESVIPHNMGHNFWAPNLQFPRLRTLHLEFGDGEASLANFCAHQVARMATSTCPALECLRTFHKNPIRASTSTLFIIERRFQPETLRSLSEYEVTDLDLTELPRLFRRGDHGGNQLVFERLHVLRIGSLALSGLPDEAWLLPFLQHACPALQKLDLLDVADPHRHLSGFGFGGNPFPVQGDGAALPPLPALTHFGHHLYAPRLLEPTGMYSEWISPRQSARAILRTMLLFPDLCCIQTNFAALITLTLVFQPDAEGQLRPDVVMLLQASVWLHVTRMELEVSHAEINEDADQELLERIRSLMAIMYPNLEELVVLLGGDRVAWKLGTDLGYLLRFVFGVDGLKRAEIRNFYNAWRLGDDMESSQPPTTHGRGSGSLESLTIRGATRSFRKQRLDATCFPPPNLDLEGLLALIPDSSKTKLNLRIEGPLLSGAALGMVASGTCPCPSISLI